MYAAIYCIPTRIVMWSAGLSLFTANQDKKAAVKKVLLHPCMVAVYIGMFFMASGLPIPEMIKNTVDSIGKCTTPLTMILIGCIIAEVDNLKSMVNRHVIYFTIIRIVIIPGLVFLLCKLFSADPVITGVSVLLSGMPAGSTAAILAAKYGGDYITGTKLVVFSTIMTLFSIPVWCFLIGS